MRVLPGRGPLDLALLRERLPRDDGRVGSGLGTRVVKALGSLCLLLLTQEAGDEARIDVQATASLGRRCRSSLFVRCRYG